jgi:hypothetical protein
MTDTLTNCPGKCIVAPRARTGVRVRRQIGRDYSAGKVSVRQLLARAQHTGGNGLISLAEIMRRMTVQAAHRVRNVLASFHPGGRACKCLPRQIAFPRAYERPQAKKLHGHGRNCNDQHN